MSLDDRSISSEEEEDVRRVWDGMGWDARCASASEVRLSSRSETRALEKENGVDVKTDHEGESTWLMS